MTMQKFDAVAHGSLSVEQAIEESTYEVASSSLSQSIWSFASRTADKLLARFQTESVSLAKYCDGQIYMGIKSGLTDAFVIDAEARAAILKRTPKASEIIKPFVNGRDVRRYSLNYKDIFLIYTFHGIEIGNY
jgi:adenine-specific DNA-methyltransferase